MFFSIHQNPKHSQSIQMPWPLRLQREVNNVKELVWKSKEPGRQYKVQENSKKPNIVSSFRAKQEENLKLFSWSIKPGRSENGNGFQKKLFKLE